MKKTSKSFSTTIALAVMMLACLLVSSFGYINAWFTYENKPIQIVFETVDPQDLLKIYQNINGTDIEINQRDEDEPTFIQLDGMLIPDEEVSIHLKVGTNDTYGFYLRFKLELFANGQQDKRIDIIQTTTEPTESSFGFKQDADGYYYYQDHNSSIQMFKSDSVSVEKKIEMVNTFKISATNYDSLNLNGETLKLVLTVECSESIWM